jgi:radical SAM protein with 4Fe4S-binding SPASM domain
MDIPFEILVKIATRTPGVFANVVRETLSCKRARWIDYPLRREKAKPPRYVDIKMTHRCNLRCSMCGQWGEEGIYRHAAKEVLAEEMELDVLKSIADEVRPHKPMFYLWGGEPFLYGDLLPFLDYLDECNLIAGMNTNGTYVRNVAADLVGGSLSNLLISLDGPRPVHDRVRGVEGTFDKVMEGVRKLKAAKEEAGSATPYLTFVTTINTENDDSFTEVYDIAEEVGADFVGLQLGSFTTKETGKAYQKQMKEHLGCEATSWRGFLSYDRDLDFEAIKEGLRKVRNTDYPFGTYFYPDLQPEDITEYYTTTRPVHGRSRCVVPWVRVDLLPNGDVYPCIDFPDYIVGNVHEKPLLELWNGPQYRRFRREVLDGLLPICGRCCAFYQF